MVLEVTTKSVSKCECRRHCGVPTPGCRSFCRLSSWRTTSRHIHHRCRNTAGIAAGDDATLLQCRRSKIEEPRFRTRRTHQSKTRFGQRGVTAEKKRRPGNPPGRPGPGQRQHLSNVDRLSQLDLLDLGGQQGGRQLVEALRGLGGRWLLRVAPAGQLLRPVAAVTRDAHLRPGGR